MELTIHIETAGTLPALIAESEKLEITELTVTGRLNKLDMMYIKEMAKNKLAILNLSGAYIVNKVIKRDYFRFWKSLTCITIPNSVTSIESYAFENCSSLTHITIPKSITSIGVRVFGGCSSLKEFIVQEESLDFSTIDGVLFNKDKTTLIRYPLAKPDDSFIIPNSVTSIEMYAFCDCVNLKSITIPDSVTTVEESVFEGCVDLEEFVVQEDSPILSVIDGVLFNKERTAIICFPIRKPCTSYIIPDSVAFIGWRAFMYCEFLTSITIPDSVTKIEAETFLSCYRLLEITIPDSVTEIEHEAFRYCVSLQSVTIPDSVASIGDMAFYRCESLTNITIPKSVTYLGHTVFRGCKSLTNITILGGVTSLFRTFAGCNSLTHITITDCLNLSILDAFEDCTEIKEIHNNAPIPQTGSICFSDVDMETCKLFVPKGSYDAYRNAKGWKEFTNIIEE